MKTEVNYKGFSMKLLEESGIRLEDGKLVWCVWYKITAPFFEGADRYGFVKDAIEYMGLEVILRNKKMILFQEDLDGPVRNARKLLRSRLRMICWNQEYFWDGYNNPPEEDEELHW